MRRTVLDVTDTTAPVSPAAPARPRWRRAAAPVIFLLAILAVRTFVLANYVIPSGSMQNTLTVGNQILVDKVFWRSDGVRRGDIVVFDGAGSFDAAGVHTIYVKRVAALPGDVIAADASGTVTVNGRPLPEPYLFEPDHAAFGPVHVPAGRMFVLGDHRADSDDSRFRGTVPLDHVVGRAVAVSWPLTKAHLLHSGR